MSEIESLLDTKAVGRVIGVSEITLRKWRMGGFGPPFIKLGSNVRYRLTDVDAWLTTRVTNSTSAADMLPQPPGSLRGAGERSPEARRWLTRRVGHVQKPAHR